MDNKEKELLQRFHTSRVMGHPTSKGNAREYFARDFLDFHLGTSVAIATGEVIDTKCLPDEKRPQIDLIIYDRDFPKIDFDSGRTTAILIESVRAIIEVKSTLSKEELRSAVEHAVWIKSRTNIEYLERRINNMPVRAFVVAYQCPAKMETIASWLNEIHESLNIDVPPVSNLEARAKLGLSLSPSIDAIFVLGHGFLSFFNPFMQAPLGTTKPDARWVVSTRPDGNLLALFIDLCWACNGTHLREYLQAIYPTVELV